MVRRVGITIIVLGLLVGAFIMIGHRAEAVSCQSLDEGEMALLLAGGTGPCKNCQAASNRLDECSHHEGMEEQPANCSTEYCVRNIITDETCELGEPYDCTGWLSDDVTHAVQEVVHEACSGWTTDYYHVWNIAYYALPQSCTDCGTYQSWGTCDGGTSCDGEEFMTLRLTPGIYCKD